MKKQYRPSLSQCLEDLVIGRKEGRKETKESWMPHAGEKEKERMGCKHDGKAIDGKIVSHSVRPIPATPAGTAVK